MRDFITFLLVVISIYLICLAAFYFRSNMYGSGIYLKKRTITILWASWWSGIALAIVLFIIDHNLKISQEKAEWQNFIKENQCVLTKINKNKLNNVWLCKKGTLQVISDNIE